ncbi:hypothetical protein PVAG01_03001 [Phlyctema vagabunda]|uniref:Ecdysoneless n=1 Tax=Phlyctema vagabunda TaxID=108571 RepID=A0ABR4PSA4_9HELO
MAVPNDDLKWFGEGFDGFPRRLPDDCVEYTLFVTDSKLRTQREILARLETIRKGAQKLINNLLKEFIWQRGPFKLDIQNEKDSVYLHGMTNYGDSVEDEWLIVYLLRELSSQFPDLWIKVVDTDGEFLLIEAANALPRWLNPEIADNRVWINGKNIHLIPLDTDEGLKKLLTLSDAQKVITSTPNRLVNIPDIETEAFFRLRNYPSQISLSLHHTVITIPRKLAYILHELPASIAPAVEAFYLRDSIALKSLNEKSESLVFAPSDLVTVSTRFTRVLYAQVKSQQFSPPSCWNDILINAEASSGSEPRLTHNLSSLETGMKLTSGFEMLVRDSKNRDNKSVREIRILLEDLASGDVTLPTDVVISEWQQVKREDDEKWLDINFEDFEKELQGRNQPKAHLKETGKFGPEPPSGFGDAKTQDDLKKMVERFEAFLGDEDAGVDGAELDDMDFDNDNEESGSGGIQSDEEDEDEDEDVTFDEIEFARMMREMMGIPSTSTESKYIPQTTEESRSGKITEEITSDQEDEDEAAEIKKLTQDMEAELREAGALSLDSKSSQAAFHSVSTTMDGGKDHAIHLGSDSDSNDEVDIDFNLAKNLLESFKSQAGMAGPGGNLIGLMGMTLPRDEDNPQLASTAPYRKE